MLLAALLMAGESRTLQENLSQKESLEGRLPYVEKIRRAETGLRRTINGNGTTDDILQRAIAY